MVHLLHRLYGVDAPDHTPRAGPTCRGGGRSPNSSRTRDAAVICCSVGLRCRPRDLDDDLDDAVDDAGEPAFCTDRTSTRLVSHCS